MSKNPDFGRNRPFWRRILDYALAACLLVSLLFVVARLDEMRAVTQSGALMVNDGDSLTLDGMRIRLKGIDAPELHQDCTAGGGTYPCGRKAREALQTLARGGKVECTGTERDQYGRLLAVCRAGTVDLNRAMVEAGWALAYGGYESAEANARMARKGLWAGTFQRPREWRQEQGRANHDKPSSPASKKSFHAGLAGRKIGGDVWWRPE